MSLARKLLMTHLFAPTDIAGLVASFDASRAGSITTSTLTSTFAVGNNTGFTVNSSSATAISLTGTTSRNHFSIDASVWPAGATIEFDYVTTTRAICRLNANVNLGGVGLSTQNIFDTSTSGSVSVTIGTNNLDYFGFLNLANGDDLDITNFTLTDAALDPIEIVTQVDNFGNSGALNPLITGGTGGPAYDLSNTVANGRPAFVWEDAINGTGLKLAADLTVRDYFIVCAYRDGTDTTFETYNGLSMPLGAEADGDRVMGSNGTAILHQLANPASAEINDAAASTTVLALPLSVMKITGVRDVGDFGQVKDVRGWQGPICEILAWSSSVTLTSGEVTQVVDYLKAKWGIT